MMDTSNPTESKLRTFEIRLKQLLDVPALESLLVNFCDLVGIGAAMVDIHGNILAKARWQRICADFHRVYSENCARCIQSDADLSKLLHNHQDHAIHRCKNGLSDAASPIRINGVHVASIFVGQFLSQASEREHFLQQAQALGFDHDEYRQAIEKVPVVEEDRVKKILATMRDLAQIIGNMGYQALQSQILRQKSEEHHRLILDSIGIGIYENNMQGDIVFHNREFCDMLGFDTNELVGKKAHLSIHHHYPDGRAFPREECLLLTPTEASKAHFDDQFIWSKDGQCLPVEYFVSPLYQDNKRIGTVISFLDISERKLMEKNLREEKNRLESAIDDIRKTESFYTQVLDAAPDGIFLMNSAQQIIYINAQIENIFGYNKYELLGHSIDMLLPDDVRLRHQQMVQKVLDHPAQYQQSFPAHAFTQNVLHGKHRDGKVFPLELNIASIERDGEILTCVSVRDITRRREMAQRLEESEQRLNLALRGANTGLWDWNAVTGDFYTNDTWSEMLGYQREELDQRYGNTHLRWEQLTHPDDLPIANAALKAHLEGKVTEYRTEFRMRTADGQWRWILDVGQIAIRDEQGKPLRLIGTHTDITERKISEQKLNEQLAFQKILFDGIPIPVYYRDEALRLVKFNAAFEAQMQGEIGKTLIETDHQMSEEEQNTLTSIYRQVLVSGKTYRGEHRLTNRHGEKREYTFWLTPYFDAQKKAIGLIGCMSDVTVIKEAERTMAEAREQAESAVAAKSQFLANMSHEIRTPMNGVIGLAHLLRRTALSTQQLDYVTKILVSADHQLGIINDILDYSKIEAGKMELEETDFKLDEVFGNLANLFAFQCEKKGIELVLNISPQLPRRLSGDPLRLGQVLINLTGNALKFTRQGEIIVSATSIDQTAEEVEVRFSVKDSGIGMTAEQCGRLFRAFSQANTSVTREYGGTGLGLSISKSLVEKMGGNIRVESEMGKGSEFYFNARFKISTLATMTSDFENLQEKRALVVDDHKLTGMVICDVLKAMHMNADCCLDGQTALQLIATADRNQTPYDMVLLDWRMPGMDGIEVAHRLSKDLALNHPPQVIMISSSDTSEIREQLGDLKVAEVLMKPINPSMLFECILGIYGGKKTPRPAPTSNDVDMKDLESIAGSLVLLVEDNEINRQVAGELLSAIGINSDTAENGEIALSMIEHRDYELILMDMQMPVMDGVTATKAIRKTRSAQKLPILALTANAIRAELDQCLQVGMNDTLTKPINPRELYAKLLQWLPHKDRGNASQTNRAKKAANLPLPEIVGLDTNAGLLHVLNKRELYVQILKQFYESQAHAAELIRAAWQSGDKISAQRFAHTLKGIAGTIGALPLRARALGVEEAIKQGKPIDESVFNELGRQLQTLCEELLIYLQNLKAQKPEKLSDLAEVERLRQQLIEQLQNQDGEAVESFNQIAANLKTMMPTDQFVQIDNAINNFDFDTALSLMQPSSA